MVQSTLPEYCEQGVECPTCGERFDNEHGVKIHHNTAHDESLGKTKRTCESCGDEFEVYDSQAERGRGRFCSKECKHDMGRVTVECSGCGEMTKKPQHRADRHSDNYCSKECYLDNGVSTWIDGNECRNCGELMYGEYPQVLESEFCSFRCQATHHNRLTPEENLQSPTVYRGAWEAARREKLEQTDYVCSRCGVSEKEYRDNHECGLHVHHIVPYDEFDDPFKANELSNLMPLCPRCHLIVEHGTPKHSGLD